MAHSFFLFDLVYIHNGCSNQETIGVTRKEKSEKYYIVHKFVYKMLEYKSSNFIMLKKKSLLVAISRQVARIVVVPLK